MPRLDATRIGVWRDLRITIDDLARRVDGDLRAEWDISLAWFDVLASLQRFGGSARPLDLAADLRIPASSISRQLDRLEEEGWVARNRSGEAPGGAADLRAVEVELTRTGRRLWREMNVSFRRAVQVHFATHLADDEVDALRAVIGLLTDSPADPVDDRDPVTDDPS
ncbi:MAG: MarR family transcriptional regulator [Acidimicrobiia bacterium]|nr:MarR family transcriptional regulator [Acidimicrobiia bacterium]